MSDSSNSTNDSSTGGSPVSPQSEINIPQKVITKIPDSGAPTTSEPVTIQQPEIKKRKYTKDPNKKYGNPLWKKGKKPEVSKPIKKDVTKTVTKKSEVSKPVVLTPEMKKPNKSLFYVGLGLGFIAGGIGLYFLIKKIREHIQSNKEVEALKYIASELEKEQNSKSLNEQFLENRS